MGGGVGFKVKEIFPFLHNQVDRQTSIWYKTQVQSLKHLPEPSALPSPPPIPQTGIPPYTHLRQASFAKQQPPPVCLFLPPSHPSFPNINLLYAELKSLVIESKITQLMLQWKPQSCGISFQQYYLYVLDVVESKQFIQKIQINLFIENIFKKLTVFQLIMSSRCERVKIIN